MRDFRKSIFRLLLMAVILLVGAWAALKVMQYKGDVEAMFRDLQHTGISRFVEEKAVPFFRDQLWPKVQELVEPVQEFLGSKLNDIG